MEYRACYWTSADGQAEVVLTSPEQAGLPDDDLRAAAIREAEHSGLVGLEEHQVSREALEDGLAIGPWTEAAERDIISRAARTLGRRGGLSTSARKIAAARVNGRKGGRPRKSE